MYCFNLGFIFSTTTLCKILMTCSFLFLLFRYSILNHMFSNSFWQISWTDSPCDSNCSESTNPSTLQIVEMGTNAETKYFFKVSFLLGLVSKYTAASQVSGGTNYPDFQVMCPAIATSFLFQHGR